MNTTLSIELDPELKDRLSELASQSGQTLAAFAEEALRQHADKRDLQLSDFAEDDARWQQYLETGESIDGNVVRRKLDELAADALRLKIGS